MTLKRLIIKYLRCHLSFVIFAFTLSLLQFAPIYELYSFVMENVQNSKKTSWFCWICVVDKW